MVYCGSSAKSELRVERELKLTRSAVVALSAAPTFTGNRAAALDISVGVARSDVVEGVEGIHAKFDGHILPYIERFGERKIGSEEPWPTISVLSRVANGIQAGVDKRSVTEGMGRSSRGIEHVA